MSRPPQHSQVRQNVSRSHHHHRPPPALAASHEPTCQVCRWLENKLIELQIALEGQSQQLSEVSTDRTSLLSRLDEEQQARALLQRDTQQQRAAVTSLRADLDRSTDIVSHVVSNSVALARALHDGALEWNSVFTSVAKLPMSLSEQASAVAICLAELKWNVHHSDISQSAAADSPLTLSSLNHAKSQSNLDAAISKLSDLWRTALKEASHEHVVLLERARALLVFHVNRESRLNSSNWTAQNNDDGIFRGAAATVGLSKHAVQRLMFDQWRTKFQALQQSTSLAVRHAAQSTQRQGWRLWRQRLLAQRHESHLRHIGRMIRDRTTMLRFSPELDSTDAAAVPPTHCSATVQRMFTAWRLRFWQLRARHSSAVEQAQLFSATKVISPTYALQASPSAESDSSHDWLSRIPLRRCFDAWLRLAERRSHERTVEQLKRENEKSRQSNNSELSDKCAAVQSLTDAQNASDQVRADLEYQLASLQQQLDDAHTSNRDLRVQHQCDLEQHSADMQSLRNELQQLSAQNESKTASTEELNISLQASRAQVESLESSNQALANELKQSQHSLSAAAETHQSQLNAAEAQYQAALSECQANHEAELNNRQIEWADESSMSAEQMRTFFQNQIEEYQRACQAKESELIDVYERKLESAKLSTQNHSDAFTQALNEVDRVEQQWRDECDRIKHEATLQSNQFQDQLRQVERADALIRETMNREREQMQTQLQQKDQRIAELEVVVANVNSDQSDQRQSTINLTAKLRVHRANAQIWRDRCWRLRDASDRQSVALEEARAQRDEVARELRRVLRALQVGRTTSAEQEENEAARVQHLADVELDGVENFREHFAALNQSNTEYALVDANGAPLSDDDADGETEGTEPHTGSGPTENMTTEASSQPVFERADPLSPTTQSLHHSLIEVPSIEPQSPASVPEETIEFYDETMGEVVQMSLAEARELGLVTVVDEHGNEVETVSTKVSPRSAMQQQQAELHKRLSAVAQQHRSPPDSPDWLHTKSKPEPLVQVPSAFIITDPSTGHTREISWEEARSSGLFPLDVPSYAPPLPIAQSQAAPIKLTDQSPFGNAPDTLPVAGKAVPPTRSAASVPRQEPIAVQHDVGGRTFAAHYEVSSSTSAVLNQNTRILPEPSVSRPVVMTQQTVMPPTDAYADDLSTVIDSNHLKPLSDATQSVTLAHSDVKHDDNLNRPAQHITASPAKASASLRSTARAAAALSAADAYRVSLHDMPATLLSSPIVTPTDLPPATQSRVFTFGSAQTSRQPPQSVVKNVIASPELTFDSDQIVSPDSPALTSLPPAVFSAPIHREAVAVQPPRAALFTASPILPRPVDRLSNTALTASRTASTTHIASTASYASMYAAKPTMTPKRTLATPVKTAPATMSTFISSSTSVVPGFTRAPNLDIASASLFTTAALPSPSRIPILRGSSLTPRRQASPPPADASVAFPRSEVSSRQ